MSTRAHITVSGLNATPFLPLCCLFPRCASSIVREGTGREPAHQPAQRCRVERNPLWSPKLSQATFGLSSVQLHRIRKRARQRSLNSEGLAWHCTCCTSVSATGLGSKPRFLPHPEIRGGQEQSEGPLRETGTRIRGGWGSLSSLWEAPNARSQGQDGLNTHPPTPDPNYTIEHWTLGPEENLPSLPSDPVFQRLLPRPSASDSRPYTVLWDLARPQFPHL